MNKRNIYIVDKLVIGYNHIVFNAAITAMIAEAYRNDNVFFISESVHAGVIADKNKSVPNLYYQPYTEDYLPVGTVKKIIPWIRKKIGDMIFINNVYKNHIGNTNPVFFTCLSSSSLLYAAYKAKKLKISVFFFLHGELEYLFLSKLSIGAKIRGKIYSAFLNQIGDASKVLVLSELIKEKLIADKYLADEKISIVEHPIVQTNHDEKPVSNKKMIFGHIGIALKKKSSELFFKIADAHLSAIENGYADFRLVGKVENGLTLQNGISAVNIISKNNKSLTQDEYERNIADIDYAIFTFNADNYVYRISGSVMDAIAFSKPIIALKHCYFNYLFKNAGNIGFLCNNIEDLNLLINKIINQDEELLGQYYLQKENLKKLMKKHSVSEIKNVLSAVI